MAINTGAAVEEFGTQVSRITTAGSLALNAFSPSSDATTFTNTDNAVSASFVFKGTFSVSPDVSGSIDLHAKLLNIQSTNDSPEPSSTYSGGYLGSFPLDSGSTSEQVIDLIVGLPNAKAAQEYDFFIQNSAGQTLSAGATVYITDTAINAKA